MLSSYMAYTLVAKQTGINIQPPQIRRKTYMWTVEEGSCFSVVASYDQRQTSAKSSS